MNSQNQISKLWLYFSLGLLAITIMGCSGNNFKTIENSHDDSKILGEITSLESDSEGSTSGNNSSGTQGLQINSPGSGGVTIGPVSGENPNISQSGIAGSQGDAPRGTPGNVGQGDYVILTGMGYDNYRETYSPGGAGSSVLKNGNDLVLVTGHFEQVSNKYKIFIPPGTKTINILGLPYAYPEESKAAARFGAAPVSTVNQINQESAVTSTTSTLKRLINGEELRFHSPAASGVISISGYNIDPNFQVSRGGYIYINFLSIPGGNNMEFRTYLVVDETCYVRWYNSARWTEKGNPSDSADHVCN